MKHHVQKLKEKISGHRKEIFIVLLIFLLAFGVRAYLMKHELFFEFDGYFHSRIISYIIQTGTYPLKDPLAYYQIGGSDLHTAGSDFFWYLSAFLYKLFTFGATYDKQTWILIVKILPALFGALIAVVGYFIGKEAFDDKKAGFFTAFFIAVMPAFIYRQMAGWLEPDSFGWLPGLIAIYFFVRAIKAEKLKSKQFFANTILAGAFAGIMGWSWTGYSMLPAMIIGFIALALVAFAIRAFALKENDSKKILIIAVASVVTIAILAVAVFPIAGLNWTGQIVSTFADKFFHGGSGLLGGSSGVLGGSIGEESLGLNYFGNKYNALILLLPFGFVSLLYYGILKRKYPAWVLLSISIVTLLMGISKLKFTYQFGLGMALLSAAGIYLVIDFARKKEKNYRLMAGLFAGFFILTGIGAGIFFTSQNYPNIEQDTGWKQALYWINANTPKDAKFFNWWDEGHWITFVGERKASLDNRNYDSNGNADVASFIILNDEERAMKIINQKKYSPDYLIFGSDLLEKQSSLASYAFQSTDLNQEERSQYGNSYGIIMKCSKTEAKVSGTVQYNCGSNNLSQEQWNSIPETWQSSPNQVLERTVFFVYKATDSEGNSFVYLLSPETNNSMLAKLWFGKKELSEKFTQVYFFKDVKVFKVK